MAFISRNKEYSTGVVTEADIKSIGVSSFDGATLPAVCLPDAERFRARYRVRVGSTIEGHDFTFKESGRVGSSFPKLGSQVEIVSTRFRVFGRQVPLIKFNRLVLYKRK